MMARDYYEVLGCSRTASEAELKAAYRKLAMEHHPDRNGGCENAAGKFKEINEAYSVLSDPNKRAAYDRFGHAAAGANMGGDPFGFGGSPFGDLFESFFGGGATGGTRRQRAVPRGGRTQSV